MTGNNPDQPSQAAHPIPVPYSVLALAWVVALIACYRFLHEIPFIAWLFGPALLLAKVYVDAEAIGKGKDNPPPVTYNLHAQGVWAQLEQTIKTLPMYFQNVGAVIPYQLLNPPKGTPLQFTPLLPCAIPKSTRAKSFLRSKTRWSRC